MRFAHLLIGTLAALLLSAGVAGATYYNGYVNADGYAYKDGLWYYDNVAYTQHATWHDGYYYNYGYGYAYQPGYYTYTYSRYYAPQPTLSHKDPGWRAKLLDIAAARDKAEAAIRKDAHEQKYFLDAVKALGLEGNFHWDGYGAAPPGYNPAVSTSHGGYGNALQLGAHGALGNTIYGYSSYSIANLYGDVSLPQLYQQAARLTANAQDLAKQATGDFSGLVGKAADDRARALEILAKAQAAKDVLQALEGKSARIEKKETVFKVMPGADNGGGGGDVQQPTPAPPGGLSATAPPQPQQTSRAKLRDLLIRQDCISCHQGAKAAGKLDLTNYAALDAATKRAVVARVVTEDETKRMPRTAAGGPGRQYSAQEAALLAE